MCIGFEQSVCAGLHEVWEDGQAFTDLKRRVKALADSKANIEAARKVSHHFVLLVLSASSTDKALFCTRQPTTV